MVTAGAASAITIATAVCMARDNLAAIDRLPDTDGLKNEVIIQKVHHCGYEPQITIAGARLVWVATRAELDRAITPRTAMMFFFNRYDPIGQIKRDEWVRVGKERGVALFNDAAAAVPPARGRYFRFEQSDSQSRSRRGVAWLGHASRRDDRDTGRDSRNDRAARRAGHRQSFAPCGAGMEPVATHSRPMTSSAACEAAIRRSPCWAKECAG